MKKLILPVCAVLLVATPFASSAEQSYKVKKGDSLYRIAKKLKVDVDDLKQANALESSDLKPGTSLVIPSKGMKKGGEPVAPVAASKASRHAEEHSSSPTEKDAPASHKVAKGDTLQSISRKYSVSVQDLRALNHLGQRGKLKVGTELTLRAADSVSGAKKPEPAAGPKRAEAPAAEHRYVVKKGDTAWSISQKFHLSLEQLAALNNGATDGLKVGQELVVPSAAGGKTAREAEPAAAETASAANPDARSSEAPAPARSSSSSVRVVVKKGDTLNSLARKHGLSVEELRALNGLKKKYRLKLGASLVVKKGTSGETRTAVETRSVQKTYVVKKGDTVRRIAKKFHLRPEELTRLNGLGRKGVKPGQKLVVAVVEEPVTPEMQAAAFERKEEEARLDSDLKNISDPGTERVGLTDRAIKIARRMLDIPYKFGGNSIRGIDCSAYVQKVFRFLNVPLPRTAREQFNHGQDIPREELATGDLVFFKTYAHFPSHVGIYLGNNKFIHASSVGKRVTIDSLEAPYYSKRFIGGKRLVDEPDAPAQQPAVKEVGDQSAG